MRQIAGGMWSCMPPGRLRACPTVRSKFGDFSIFRSLHGTEAAIDSLLFRLSTFGVPIAIGVISLIALFDWDRQYPGSGGTNLEFRYLQETSDTLEPAQALAQLDAAPTAQYYDTRLSESSFWVRFVVPVTVRGDAAEVELPSRHALETTCWDASNLSSLGHASRSAAVRPMKAVKAGFAIEMGRLPSSVTVLCRGTFAGPARISVLRWSVSELDSSIQQFHRESGLLDGGLIVLTLFVLLTAIINRQWLYVLFAAWLVANLRLAALSAGWDTQWFARTIPPDWMLPMRKLAIAAYYVLTITLFSRLFRNELMRVGYPTFLQIVF